LKLRDFCVLQYGDTSRADHSISRDSGRFSRSVEESTTRLPRNLPVDRVELYEEVRHNDSRQVAELELSQTSIRSDESYGSHR